MQREESIYNLIPVVPSQYTKQPRYQSQHDPLLQPTGTTFGLQGKNKLIGANLGSSKRLPMPAAATGMGRITDKVDTKNFIKKGEKSKTFLPSDSKASRFSYAGAKKASVIKRDDAPVMGLKSQRNYITANAVDAILAAPGHRAAKKKEQPQYINKEDYGKVPKYLEQVKDEINCENKIIEDIVRRNRNEDTEQGNQATHMLDEKERMELVNALKGKWDHVNGKYQKLCHNVIFDTLGKVRRKETLEKELTQLEKDIELLERGPVAIK